jgi:hypothetical protein
MLPSSSSCITDQRATNLLGAWPRSARRRTGGRRREQRRGGAEPDRAGGEVNGIGILGAARVGLQTAERAQRRQVAAVQVAEQVLDGMEDRRGVRLDDDLVRGIQVREVQGGHDGDQAGAGGLVPADLDAVAGVAVVVGRVHDAGRQPRTRWISSRTGSQSPRSGARPR